MRPKLKVSGFGVTSGDEGGVGGLVDRAGDVVEPAPSPEKAPSIVFRMSVSLPNDPTRINQEMLLL